MREEDGNGRTRDADASRRSILDAAESLFADQGFDATSIHDISRRAGVSRGTPGYFFGSKEQLYRAVLERAFAGPRARIAGIRSEVARGDLPPEEAIAAAIGGYFDYLVEHPSFIRLVEWESLGGGTRLGDLPAHVESLKEGVAAVARGLHEGGLPEVDATQLLIDTIALCWFPLAHEATLLRALGVDIRDPEVLAARRRRTIDVVTASARARSGSRP